MKVFWCSCGSRAAGWYELEYYLWARQAFSDTTTALLHFDLTSLFHDLFNQEFRVFLSQGKDWGEECLVGVESSRIFEIRISGTWSSCSH